MTVDLGYRIIRQFPVLETAGTQGSTNATAVGIETNGHGVYLEFRVPDKVYSAQQVKDYATGYTGTVEQMFELAGVIGVQWFQDATPANQLADMALVTVESDSGDSQQQFQIPFRSFTPANVEKQAKPIIAKMNAAEATSTPLPTIF